MNRLLCLPLFVLIFIFDSVINAKGDAVHIYSTKGKHTWLQVKNECSLLRNETENIDIKNFNSDLRWTGYSARYLPWIEYLGCVGFKKEKQQVADSISVHQGKQLIECLMHCKNNSFIGLQQSNCVCLHYLKLTNDYIKFQCDTITRQCQGDEHALCGSTRSGDKNAFALYQKVNVTERVDDGNCLAVDKNNDSYTYEARNCSSIAFQICLKESILSTMFDSQHMSNASWIDSFKLCSTSHMLARYSLVYTHATFLRRGTYWLSNTRRWIQGTFTNPEFCIAARVKGDGSLQRFPLRCERKLPGLCVSREKPDHETNGNKMTSSDNQPPINKVLLISVIAATSLVIIVAVVILIFCIRMKRLQSNSAQNQIVVDGKNVVYAQVDQSVNQDRTTNRTTGQSPVEDTYDHMDHRCLNQMPPKEESNYDTMSKVGIMEENDYSHTNETETERQCFVDASSEYSHVTVVAKPKTID